MAPGLLTSDIYSKLYFPPLYDWSCVLKVLDTIPEFFVNTLLELYVTCSWFYLLLHTCIPQSREIPWNIPTMPLLEHLNACKLLLNLVNNPSLCVLCSGLLMPGPGPGWPGFWLRPWVGLVINGHTWSFLLNRNHRYERHNYNFKHDV